MLAEERKLSVNLQRSSDHPILTGRLAPIPLQMLAESASSPSSRSAPSDHPLLTGRLAPIPLQMLAEERKLSGHHAAPLGWLPAENGDGSFGPMVTGDDSVERVATCPPPKRFGGDARKGEGNQIDPGKASCLEPGGQAEGHQRCQPNTKQSASNPCSKR